MAFLYIDRDECIGDSLGKINDNAFSFDQRITSTESIAATLLTVVNAVSAATVVFQDRKPSGISGGTAIGNAWATRALNTKTFEYPANTASINPATNAFLLPAGTWLIRASAPAYRVDRHRIRLWNVTAVTPVAQGEGTSEYSFAAQDDTVTHSKLEVIVTLTNPTEFRIEHRTSATRNQDGFGVAAVFSGIDEIYTTVTCSRVG